jgi:hypothetical protein
LDRLRDPGWIARTLPYAGIGTLLISLCYLVLYLVEVDDIVLQAPVFAMGAFGLVLTVIGSITLLITGDEDNVDTAYLGMGLSIATFMLLGFGAVLAWS